MRTMGIDIGTTTISVVMVNGENGELLGSCTVPNRSFMKGNIASARIQNPETIWELASGAAREIIKEYGSPASIGMTGQMHGMLYVDDSGKAVSPLYTWQDGSGNELLEEGRTSAEILREATGSAAAGYGLTTHYYLLKKGLVPKKAARMVTISDYIAMRLCEEKSPSITRDMAASWGCYDLEIGDFCREELEELGVDLSFLPTVLTGHSVMGMTTGKFPHHVPVTVSLGDNQASVLGSVQDLSNTVLVSIGTGSQVSFGTSRLVETGGSIELRPCTESLYLMTGSGLCGGRAYAMLEQFYREALESLWEEASILWEIKGTPGANKGPGGRNLYKIMENQARDFMETYGKEAAWKIRTTFSGTRNNPKERGSIRGIGVENFHPGAMTLGMMQGILEELHEMYIQMCRMTGNKAVRMVGSGNGVRENALLRELAEEMFRMPMEIPACREEAAYGAALQAYASAGFAGSMREMQDKICYL